MTPTESQQIETIRLHLMEVKKQNQVILRLLGLEEEWLDLKVFAAATGISYRKALRFAQEGLIRTNPNRKVGGKYLVHCSEVERIKR